MSQILFIVLSFFTILSALFVVFSRKPVYSVLWLIACFFLIAGHYFVILDAQFLGIVHVIVYAGAIMVLFLFVVMLLNLNNDTEMQKSNYVKISAVIAGGLLFLTLLASLRSAELGRFSLPAKTDIGYVQNIGQRLFTDYLLPFEISSILFLSAMIGAVVLAKKETN